LACLSKNWIVIDAKPMSMVSFRDVDLEMIHAETFTALFTPEQVSLDEYTDEDYVLIESAFDDEVDTVNETISVSRSSLKRRMATHLL